MRTLGPLLLLLAACAEHNAPELQRKLRDVGVTRTADIEAVEAAEQARQQLDAWAAEGAAVRRAGTALDGDDPLLDGRAAAEIAALRAAADVAESGELREVILTLARAHEERLEVLVSGRKLREKAYLRADRRTTEIAFALRHWRGRR